MDLRNAQKEVLEVYQKISPSKLEIEKSDIFKSVEDRLKKILFKKLKIHNAMFDNSTVLDFGCGTGEKDVILAKWGAFVEGIDFNNKSVERAKEISKFFSLKNNLDFTTQDVLNPVTKKDSYDFVISLGVIPHVDNPKKLLENMASRVKDDGFCVLGYLDISGNLQRILHGSIVKSISKLDPNSDLNNIALELFEEHLDRCSKYGGRSKDVVINDYITNPHSWGIDTFEIIEFMQGQGLELYSSYPLVPNFWNVLPPEHKETESNFDHIFIRIQQFLWMFANNNNQIDIPEDVINLKNYNQTFKQFQTDVHSLSLKNKGEYLINTFNDIDKILTSYISHFLKNTKHDIQVIIELINQFETSQVCKTQLLKSTQNSNLFKGFNGFGTCYLSFYKP